MSRRWSIPFVAAVLVIAGCGHSRPTTIRVLSYNIHHGAGTDGVIDLERIAAVIRRTEADLVALNEVDRGVSRTGRVDQPARLAERTGLHATFEKNIDFQGGEYGNAILSRWPVCSHENHALPQLRPNEQRGLLEVRVRVAGRALVFCATHFDYRPDDAERQASVGLLRELVAAREGYPVIVAGDLNARPDSRVINTVTSFLSDSFVQARGDGFTFPAEQPDRRIDYILYRATSGLRCIEHRVIDEPAASDHRPVLAVFELHIDAAR